MSYGLVAVAESEPLPGDAGGLGFALALALAPIFQEVRKRAGLLRKLPVAQVAFQFHTVIGAGQPVFLPPERERWVGPSNGELSRVFAPP